MLKIIDEKEMRTEESIEQEYKGCMFIMINYTDLQNPRGYLYWVSNNSSKKGKLIIFRIDV